MPNLLFQNYSTSKWVYILLLCWCFFWPLAESMAQTYEADYIDLIHAQLGGQQEVGIKGGRVDVLTETHAIEVEFAHKWKNAIGQAIWYGLQTNRASGIVLIRQQASDQKYIIMLGSALSYAELDSKIQVWVWPDDFQQSRTPPPRPYQTTPPPSGSYWLTTSTKTRHNPDCQYFKKTRGRACTAGEGLACRKCGG